MLFKLLACVIPLRFSYTFFEEELQTHPSATACIITGKPNYFNRHGDRMTMLFLLVLVLAMRFDSKLFSPIGGVSLMGYDSEQELALRQPSPSPLSSYVDRRH